LWVTLIHSEDNLAGLPWALDEWKMRSINMLEWISGHHHEGLLSLIQQCSTTNIPVESLRPLFPIIAAEARAEFLNIPVQSQDGTIEDSETAMKKAFVSQLRTVLYVVSCHLSRRSRNR